MIKAPAPKLNSKKSRLLLLIALIFLALAGTSPGLGAFWEREVSSYPKEYEVRLTPSGFSPNILKIGRGSTVTFKSDTGEMFWPASNFHPTHEIYAEFDPKKPLEPTDYWSFTFNEVGTWRYHNHLNPSIVGTIVVGNTLAERVFGFNDPCLGGKFPETAKNRSLQIRCWQKELDKALQKDGLDKAFQVFNKLYKEEPGFSSACHDMTHLLGEAAYSEFTKTTKVQHSDQTVNCSYGFYHGFIEAMLQRGQGYEKVLSYCRKVQDELKLTISSPSAYTRCFHGIGHGVFDTLPQETWGDEEKMVGRSLAVCKKLASGDPSLLFSCSKGVFNALTNAYAYDNYGLKLNLTSPFNSCRTQVEEAYRRACHVEVGLIYIRTKGLDLTSAVSFIEKDVPEESSRAELILAQISQNIQDHSSSDINLPGYISTCQKFDGLTREKCIRGIIEGIFISGNPGSEYENGLTLCRNPSLTTSDRDNCYVKLRDMIYLTYPKDKAREICRRFEPSHQTNCN